MCSVQTKHFNYIINNCPVARLLWGLYFLFFQRVRVSLIGSWEVLSLCVLGLGPFWGFMNRGSLVLSEPPTVWQRLEHNGTKQTPSYGLVNHYESNIIKTHCEIFNNQSRQYQLRYKKKANGGYSIYLSYCSPWTEGVNRTLCYSESSLRRSFTLDLPAEMGASFSHSPSSLSNTCVRISADCW